MTIRKILLVDDEPHVIRILRLMLEREGYHVESANDGNQALDKMVDFAPDVMITDIQMAGMDGRTLCRTARERYAQRTFLILVMTSMTAMEERGWVRELSNIDFLEKPLSPRQLVVRLAKHFVALASDPETSNAG
ncbi:DNA-binding response OmpR family regulator [Actimicrobium sp. GrIS 1.19]|uniref:response regulator n=1 Tax=Actimicrobium sp. GrIS 1.19 TaxID=3071708 RepID=UPI002DFF2D67|nr:DNA-binding response OmpR family regulator [Actimicrobium sp. GrIS 1.19]